MNSAAHERQHVPVTGNLMKLVTSGPICENNINRIRFKPEALFIAWRWWCLPSQCFHLISTNASPFHLASQISYSTGSDESRILQKDSSHMLKTCETTMLVIHTCSFTDLRLHIEYKLELHNPLFYTPANQTKHFLFHLPLQFIQYLQNISAL